jgi:CheY-like chemotaxis protein
MAYLSDMYAVARMANASSCIFCRYLQLQVNSNKKPLMKRKPDKRLALLVVEDIAETRDGIEKLLNADGYHVAVARDERDAIERALLKRPNLILVSLAGPSAKVVVTARRIRELADLGEQVPIVVFCVGEIAEGDEVAIGQNVHLTRPDNFNQLRSLITRLLPHSIPKAA